MASGLSPSGGNRDFLNNTGKGIYWLLGGRDTGPYGIVIALLKPLIAVGAVGAKLYLRKQMRLMAINPLSLIFHLAIIYVLVYLFRPNHPDFADNFIGSLRAVDPFVFYYLVGLLILATIHYIYFKHTGEEHSEDSGIGIAHIFWKGGEDQKKYLRLIDPIILAIGVCFFFTMNGGSSLIYIVWVSCFCLFFEEVFRIYREWDLLRRVKDADIEARKLGNKLNKKPGNKESSFRAQSARD